ncbi:MAG: peptide-methionine (S)-S-oxide reductase MsrA [Betaproteobacteria bacterium]|nr:MAG: peptide-methionine (S)-S-oxide reductase MsrA [Betaproteobacteria bacterium]
MSFNAKPGVLRDALRSTRGVWVALLALLAIGTFWNIPARTGEPAVTPPVPAIDNPKAAGPLQTAVIAGGCFWGVQGVFQHTKGVKQALSGYSGGEKSTAEYEKVGTGRTGHAESVQVVFDPHEISYGDILRIYFSVAHDPTELNRQGPDVGTQYRSAIFYADASQQRIAQAYISQLEKARAFARPIVTRVDPLKGFYPAEAYHQDFLVHNPTYPYIVINDLPKIVNLKRLFPEQYREKPVLTASAS